MLAFAPAGSASAHGPARGHATTPRLGRHHPRRPREKLHGKLQRAHAAIVGGTEISITQAPWQVRVEERIPTAGGEEVFGCSGSILSATEVLTAAHCAFNGSEQVPASEIFVKAGTSDFKETEGQTVDVGAVRVHPDYGPNTNPSQDNPYDVAVLELEEPITTPAAKPIALAQSSEVLPVETAVKVAGFGWEVAAIEEADGTLNSIDMHLVSSQDCGGENEALFLCGRTPEGSVCFGDSGSGLTLPATLTTEPKLIGVTDTVEERCANNALAGFANLTAPVIRNFVIGAPQQLKDSGAEIVGSPQVGQSLTCEPGQWTGAPTVTYTFIDSPGGPTLQSGSSPTYTLSAGDVGQTVLCEVHAVNKHGSGSARTEASPPIEAVPVLPSVMRTVDLPPPSNTSTPIIAPLASNVALLTTGITVQNGNASVKVQCHGIAICHGQLTLTTKTTVQFKGKPTLRTVPIGTASFSIPGGGSKTVKIKLGPVGRSLLNSDHGRLAARLAIVKLEPAPRQSQVKVVQLVTPKARRSAK